MKKNLIFHALAVAALAMSACTKEQAEVKSGESAPTFSIIAIGEKLRTEMGDGLEVKWKEGDAINLYHAPAGTKNYNNDGKFTVSDLAKGTFTGTLSRTLSADSSYMWYAIYPYDASATGPNADHVAALRLGGESKDSQSQTAKDDVSGLAGALIPLYGRDTTAIGSQTVPTMTMKQLASILQIKVINKSDAKLPVRTIGFKFGGQKIFGSFKIRIDAKEPVYTQGTVGDTVTLSVTDFSGEKMLNPGDTASYYIAVKPFTSDANSVLSMSVNGYRKSQTVSAAKTFSAGAIKPFTFKYERESYDYVKVSSLDEITEGEYIIASGDYLFPNAETSSSPEAKQITDYGYFTGSKFTPAAIRTSSDEITWTFTGNNQKGFELASAADANLNFYSDGKTAGIRVSRTKSTDCVFETNGTGLAMLANSRYNAIRNSDLVWANYGTATHSYFYNGGVLNLYKKESRTPVILASDITDVSGAGVNGATAPYEVKYFADDVRVESFSGCVSSASASAGTITYSVSRNWSESRVPGTIVLSSASGKASKIVNVLQNARDSIFVSRTVLSEFAGKENGTQISTFALDSVITATASTKGNTGKVYDSGASWAFYETNGGTLTISSSSSHQLVSVSVEYKVNSNKGILKIGDTVYDSGSILKVNADSLTFSVGHSSGTSNGSVYVKSFTVTYAEKPQ